MEQSAVDELVALLDLEPIEVNMFRGISPKVDRQRVRELVLDGRSVQELR